MGHTPGPWVAIKDDVFNPDRTWGVSKYLSREQCEEIDGEDATWPSRTEVIAEVCSASNGTDEADAKLMAAAPDLLEVCKELLEEHYLFRKDNRLVCPFCMTESIADCPVNFPHSPDCPVLKARQVIAKAEGREA